MFFSPRESLCSSGVYDIEKFLNNLIRAVSGEKLMAPEKSKILF
ncbi:MAG: hypothetical protein ACLRQF_08645 [Thomasclavelia ramosa]